MTSSEFGAPICLTEDELRALINNAIRQGVLFALDEIDRFAGEMAEAASKPVKGGGEDA